MSVPEVEFSRAGTDWPAAVIASGNQTGLLVARSLERRGVRCYLIDCDPDVESFRSRYGTSLVCPNPDTSPEAWLAFMRDLAAKLGGQPALMAASDLFVSAIGRFADQLDDCYRLSSSAKLQAELAVKEGQIRLAEEHGLPVPRTRYANTEAEVRAFAAEARFPVLFKPRQHRFWKEAPPGNPMYQVKAVQSEDEAELLRNYRLAAELSPDVVLQEVIQGPDTNKRVHVAIYRRDGEKLGHLTLKELRCVRFGVPSVCEPIEDEVVAETCDRFLRSIGYLGTCEIELMWDERDGVPRMMDINPRFTGSGDAVPYSGIDQAWMIYLDLLGKPVEPVTATHLDFRHVMLVTDLRAMLEYWQQGLLSWSSLRQSFRGPVYFWDLDVRDGRLLASTAWRTAGKIVAWTARTAVDRLRR